MNTLTVKAQDWISWTHKQMDEFYKKLEELYREGKASMFVDRINHREFLYDGWVYEFGWSSPCARENNHGGWFLCRRAEDQGQTINAEFRRGHRTEDADYSHSEPHILFAYKGWFCIQGTSVMSRTDKQINAGVDIGTLKVKEHSIHENPIFTIERLVSEVKMKMNIDSKFIGGEW
jgi:hypothetical protein